MAIIGQALMPKMTILAKMGITARTNCFHKLNLYEYPWKIWSKCRSMVKTVLKMIHSTQFYGQNKKM